MGASTTSTSLEYNYFSWFAISILVSDFCPSFLKGYNVAQGTDIAREIYLGDGCAFVHGFSIKRTGCS